MNRPPPPHPQLPGVDWKFDIQARQRPEYLYVFTWLDEPTHREYAGCYKIGRSSNVNHRHESFSDTVLLVPGVPGIPNTTREEAAIHRRLAPYQVPYLHPSDLRARRGARNGSSEIYYPAPPVLEEVDMLSERYEQYEEDVIHGRDAFWWGELAFWWGELKSPPVQQNDQDS